MGLTALKSVLVWYTLLDVDKGSAVFLVLKIKGVFSVWAIRRRMNHSKVTADMASVLINLSPTPLHLAMQSEHKEYARHELSA